jgi:hypothetical protein
MGPGKPLVLGWCGPRNRAMGVPPDAHDSHAFQTRCKSPHICPNICSPPITRIHHQDPPGPALPAVRNCVYRCIREQTRDRLIIEIDPNLRILARLVVQRHYEAAATRLR